MGIEKKEQSLTRQASLPRVRSSFYVNKMAGWIMEVWNIHLYMAGPHGHWKVMDEALNYALFSFEAIV